MALEGLVVGIRTWSVLVQPAVDAVGALQVASYAFTTAGLLCACYLQNSKWRGISLAIAVFARSVLEGEISCLTARMRWRELIGAMRQTSRRLDIPESKNGFGPNVHVRFVVWGFC
ncbi:Dnmt3b [Symbiodinium sp. KB8]|nr:Dnmt3b [Symbiodinium sp. KB8]